MGIKYFFSWLKSEFPQHLTNFRKTASPRDICIDTFMIDLNGVFHNSAAKIYKYGLHEEPKSLLRNSKPQMSGQQLLQQQIQCFEDICKTIDELVNVVKPQKNIVLCIDGVAPLSKQNQQRQRRYRSIVEDKAKVVTDNRPQFDPRSITPGTKWMDYLSKYIDWFLKKKMSEDDEWRKLKIYFSNEKVPGEGEHKLINWIRKYGTQEETYCINALDADLVMLSLGTQKENFYLLREELYDKSFDYSYVNVGTGLRRDISKNLLFWDGSRENQIINDFILILFLCGNDFLPNIPSVQLVDKGLNTIIETYKQSCKLHGHLVDEKGKIRTESFAKFFRSLANSEKSLLEDKWSKRVEYLPDPLLDSHVQKDQGKLSFESYKKEFYEKKGVDNVNKACEEYVKGCGWVLRYYLFGVNNWSYMYPYNYSPFSTDIATYLEMNSDFFTSDSFLKFDRKEVAPASPFLQLLCVIPPPSSFLLPKPLNGILHTKKEKIKAFFPSEFHINYDGKKKAWEGVVELPPVDVTALKEEMDLVLHQVDQEDAKRNVKGKNFCYTASEFAHEIKSYYGNFLCFVSRDVSDF
jgi:5'-3' exonuclease